MKITYFVRCLVGLVPLLLTTAFQARAHNGSFAIAAPVENIAIDGEFSDWPAGLQRYPIDRRRSDGGRQQ